ncbi:MAG: radical SAM protein [Bacteroidales bacterium]|jgi:MoaA/NifB/PqqE/SkfB family radical SAM enzyme|nr:radical SAM protein [Bacteroidales bacterium]
MKQFLYVVIWFIRCRFLGERRPLQTVIFITNACNLSCKHCSVYEHQQPISKTTSQIQQELEYAYGQGSRFVDFEGGEPLLWRDGDKTVNDLVVMAKQTGFFSCSITTNAQLSFENTVADTIWVSLDGIGEVHDAIRGKGAFAQAEKNIAAYGRSAVSVNMVINTLNCTNVVQTIEYVKNNPYIHSISLNFHTPYSGTEYLFLEWKKREKLIDEIIQMKKAGYPIINSVSGLRLMKHVMLKKQCWISNFILVDGTRLSECAGKTANICDKCGYGMAAEMKSIFDCKPDTLLAGLNLRMKKQ